MIETFPITATGALAPVSQGERISSVDVLRGTALLGIVLIHVVMTGLPLAAFTDPSIAGGHTGPNLFAYALQYVVFDGKLRGMFSIVFGASAYYFIRRGELHGAGVRGIELYYRRTLWLMLFGILHAYFIWLGDILYPYALLGLFLFPLMSLRPRTLLVTASVFIVALTLMSIGGGGQIRKDFQIWQRVQEAEEARRPVTDDDAEHSQNWVKVRKYISPTTKELKDQEDMALGSYRHLLAKRAALIYGWHSTPFYLQGWDMLTMMLIGIALAKMRVLTGERSWSFYRGMLALGWGIGLPIGAASLWVVYRSNFSLLENPLIWSTYHIGRVLTSLGHVSLILMVCKAGILSSLTSRLAAVGRTAFSNYIAHSILYGFIFYGYGLGFYGKLQRYQVFWFVPGIWAFSLIASPLWMRHFRYGPLEWCWRSLTYWKRQPMRTTVAVRRELAVGSASGQP